MKTESTQEQKLLAIPVDLFCQECGYNLRGSTSNRCSECGNPLDSVRSQTSCIPWAHRKKIGYFKAYWKTVFWTSIRYKRFCEELAKPLRYKDSQSFRWVTIAHVWVPLLILTLVACFGQRYVRIGYLNLTSFTSSAVWLVCVIHATFLGMMLAITGVPSYFFDSRQLPIRQRNSAIAMSYYCAGSLAWFSVPVILFLTGLKLTDTAYEMAGLFMAILGAVLPIAQLIIWKFDLIHTASRVFQNRRKRRIAVIFLMPLAWLASMMIVITIPILVYSIVIIVTA